ncbi:ARM repeat-containing protein [Xylariaceae sp. FL0662B]|nr:ARM repeat-containing protein [Xylariaceae sp. FL0662B]
MAMAFDSQTLLAKLGANIQDQIAALRYLKNDVIGHVQKKEFWVRHGVLIPIVRIIAPNASELGGKDVRQPFLTLTAFTDEDTAKLQALQLLASFANAGPAFLPPLNASGALPAVLSNSCLRNEHPEIVLAALRVVRDIAAAATLAPPSSLISITSLADTLFTGGPLESLCHILSQSTRGRNGVAQISIVTYLIKSLCHEDRHQSVLVSSGILDTLATDLASFAVSEGQVIPRAEIIARSEGLADYIPEAAAPGSRLDWVLGAIATIIGDSPFRACKLLYSPSILAVFPVVDVDAGKCSKSPPGSMELPGLRPTRQNDLEAMDLLLPYTPAQSRGQANNTAGPTPGSSSSKENLNLKGRPSSTLHSSNVSWTPPEETFAPNRETETEEPESPLIPWLIHLIRSRGGNEMLMAASILTSLFKAGFAYKTREASLSLLVVPALLSMLKEVESKIKDIDYSNFNYDTASRLSIIEEGPAVLARLITDSESLQKAAFDCDAVQLVCKLLRNSYEAPIPPTGSRLWYTHNKSTKDTEGLPPERRLGEEGQHRYLIHRVKVRESTLRAIGALASFKEEYRKAIIKDNLVAHIVESLSESPGDSKPSKNPSRSDVGTSSLASNTPGPKSNTNPISVIIAACYAIRMLSRSVNILRTTLVDHSVSTPLLRLLRHPDIKVQIAATASMCNLVPEFSPMRKVSTVSSYDYKTRSNIPSQPLVDAGILKVLCEHAHSGNASLRLSALWALKHLVDSATVDLKKRCVEELESGWLVRLICDDTEDDALFSARERNDRKTAQDALDDLGQEMDVDLAEDADRPWLSASFYQGSTTRSVPESRILRDAEIRLATLREAELSPIRKARHDDLAIQEQGLGFIRNLIGGAHSGVSADSANDTTEMIDFLFSTLGQDRLFEILASKLKVKVLHPYNRRGVGGSESRVLPPQAKIIEAVIYILVHIAASVPRHRQLVISQTELLKQLVKLFTSQDREVRVALCHLINNLTWQDNANDASECSQRALELKKLGFLSKLEALKEGDDELDVRERAKSALWQMKPAAH